MKNPFRILSVMLLAFTVMTLSSTAKSKLRLNLKKGTTYEMSTTMTMNMDQEIMGQKVKMEQKMEMILNYKVLEELANQNYLLEYAVTRIKIGVNANGQQVDMDSENESNPAAEKLKGLIGSAVKIEITPAGKIEKVEGLEEMLKNAGGDKMMEQMIPMFSSDEGFKSFMSQTFGYLPEDKVGTGDKWSNTAKMGAPMNMEIDMDYELLSLKKSKANLQVNSVFKGDTKIEQSGISINMNIDGSQTGTMLIDAKDGWLRSSELNQDIKMVMKMKNPQTGDDMEMPVAMTSMATISVVKK